MTNPNPLGYLSSLADELLSQAKRVRDLIGDRHWLSDGHHKEYLLKNLLLRHCPASTLVARGFVVNPRDLRSCSREQDLLIIDTHSEAPIFFQGGLGITSPKTLLAAISVKTTLGKTELTDAVASLATVRSVAGAAGIASTRTFCGAYFFEVSPAVQTTPSLVYHYLQSGMNESATPDQSTHPQAKCAPTPDYIVTPQLLYKITAESDATCRVDGFSCSNFGTALFLAALSAHIASLRGVSDPDLVDIAENPSILPLNPPSHSIALAHSSG
jgi:hypothetical protein